MGSETGFFLGSALRISVCGERETWSSDAAISRTQQTPPEAQGWPFRVVPNLFHHWICLSPGKGHESELGRSLAKAFPGEGLSCEPRAAYTLGSWGSESLGPEGAALERMG